MAEHQVVQDGASCAGAPGGESETPLGVLVMSVGTDAKPLDVILRTRRPRHVIFFATTRSVESIGALIASLRSRGVVFTHESVVVQDGDDLDACFRAAVDVEAAVRRAGADRAVVDVTGGSKPLSGGLTLGAARWESVRVTYGYVGGPRGPDGKVIDGHEVPRTIESPVRRSGLDFLREISIHARGRRDAAAADVAARAESEVASDRADLFAGLRAAFHAFDAWDRFQHRAAVPDLGRAQKRLETWLVYRESAPVRAFASSLAPLAALAARVAAATTSGPDAPILVSDLIANGLRRSAAGNADDAAARWYRSIELCGQIAFQRRTGHATGRVPRDVVPASLREAMGVHWDESGGCFKLPLMSTFEVLAALGDPAAAAFESERAGLLALLAARNNSILAHGLAPVSPQTAAALHAVTVRFHRASFGSDPVAVEFPALEGV